MHNRLRPDGGCGTEAEGEDCAPRRADPRWDPAPASSTRSTASVARTA